MSTILSDADYASIYSDISNTYPDWIRNALAIIDREIIAKLARKQAFLDIGPGPGLMTREISSAFATTSIVEPNPEFRKRNAAYNYQVIAELFQDASLSEDFDFILCSYVLYHVEHKDWRPFIEKLIRSVGPGGRAFIVMGAPRGYHYAFRTSFNPACVHSGYAIDILTALGVRHQVVQQTDSYSTDTLDEMNPLCRFSIYESCFSESEYSGLSAEDKARIDQEIRAFAQEQKRPDGQYVFTYEADFIIVAPE
jgi:SAM-dependent methyltransferase